MPYKDPEEQRAYQRAWMVEKRKKAPGQIGWHKRRAWLTAQKDKPCADCGQRFPHYAMDFDHVSGEKLGTITQLLRTASMARLEAEVAKCELVCANCHRIRTWERGQCHTNRTRKGQPTGGDGRCLENSWGHEPVGVRPSSLPLCK